MTWVAVAIGGSALIGAGASYAGSKKQSDSSKAAANLQMDQFGLLNQQQQPFIRSSYGAMGKLNTLLGLNPNPNAQAPPGPNWGGGWPDRTGQEYMPTPDGGVQPIMQVGQPNMFAGGPGGDPRSGGSSRLRDILTLRAQHGDTQAARMLGRV